MIGRVAVCSWSLRAKSGAELAMLATSCGISHVQLALDPLRRGGEIHGPDGVQAANWGLEETLAALSEAGVGVVSGMMACKGEDYTSLETIEHTGGVRLDSTWADNLIAARENAAIAKRLGLKLVTFHAGYLPGSTNDPERRVLVDRINAIADCFAAVGAEVALETGQETAQTLIGVLEEINRPDLGVNFDPANMILYGKGEPIAAMKALEPWIRQVHIKDAKPTKVPGTWGEEVAGGTGAVDWKAFVEIVRGLTDASGRARTIDLVIEREGGDQRVKDIVGAREMIEGLMR
ncbi:MAG: sugar phosphate isomerase/epimerase [Phycisphaeraceae bacterium]|nr:sugar phosphate isomerase/epimerase [Phycisphaeraceae bacterium]MBX3366033.1 sugar phosphate isomerase/epimerase [Phycisphaeraceae bacterium]